MRQADAFRRLILQHPEQDAPRLLFADWLDERGDARAEFIRLQCALARLPANDPRAVEWQERADNLLKEHEHEWVEPLRGLVSGSRFHRGFVDTVFIDARQFLLHAATLFDVAPVRHVHLLDVGSHMPQVAESPFLNRLDSLTVFASHQGDALARALAGSSQLGRLVELNLGRNRITDLGVAALAGSPALSRLVSLDLSENHITETGAQRLASAPALSHLATLNLTHNSVGASGAQALLQSSRLTKLHLLKLGFNQVSGFVSPGDAPVLRRLRVLDLSGNGLDGGGLAPLLESPSMVGLHTLDMSHNLLGDYGAHLLAQSPHVAGLRTLVLVDNRITDAGLRLLNGSPFLTRATLNIANNPIGDVGSLFPQRGQ